LVSYDIYRQRKPDAGDKQLVRVGRISAGLALLFSLALLPLLNRYESIFNGLNDIIAHIAPPITCVFLVGVFWRKATPLSAKLTLWIGSALGASVFVVDKLFPDTVLGHIPFMMMAFYLFVFCLVLQVACSWLYPLVRQEAGLLSWRSPLEPLRRPGWKGLGNYRFLSACLLVVMGLLFWLFR
jgi:SSS family solute:Na+ symporter